jgi:hypothetical protein
MAELQWTTEKLIVLRLAATLLVMLPGKTCWAKRKGVSLLATKWVDRVERKYWGHAPFFVVGENATRLF